MSEILDLKTIHKLIFTLFLLTVLAIVLHWKFGEQKILRINPNQYQFLATNDQYQKGESTSSITQKHDVIELNCELINSENYPWPYCGVAIRINELDMLKGLDLSDYHTARLDIDFVRLDSDEKPTLRFYLRNYNPAYSTPDNEYTLKYNGLDYRQADYDEPLVVPLKNLQVLTWWLVDNSIPIEHSGPEFNNITLIEFATGSGAGAGKYLMRINSIEFVGHYIKSETLMFWLLMIWISLALLFSVMQINESRRRIALSEVRREHLNSLNQTLVQQNIEFAEQAHRDALTGAMNRHAIREWLESEFDSVIKNAQDLSVIYLDIDHFKRVNDQYGHKMGDDILREFSIVIMTELRASDRFVRWGGEEFVIFCPGNNLKRTYMLAERLRQKVELHPWLHGDVLTVSMGVTQMKDETALDMITRADDLLYRAKHEGRNQVVTEDGVL